MKPPHIVIFNPDQWRGDVMGHLGNPAAVTPHLDALVRREAVSFRYAFCQNPVCTPSRCSFMTGWYPHVHGHRTMHHMLHIERDEPVLLNVLKNHGYRVWWSGRNDLIPGDADPSLICDVRHQPGPGLRPLWGPGDDWRGPAGGDHFYSFYRGRLDKGPQDHYHDIDWAWVQGAVEFLLNAPKDKPLCVFLPLIYPHPPYAVEDPWYSQIDRARLPPRLPAPDGWRAKPSTLAGIAHGQRLFGWTEERWTELRATYYGMCARVDHQFGLVLQALKTAGIYDETAVFFFSDHGDFTGDYGLVEKTQNTFEDCLSRVPFILKPPAAVQVRPRVSDALVELVDFPATVYDLTGIEPGYSHFGRSLLPLATGAADAHRDAVFCEGGRRHGEPHCMESESRGAHDPKQLYWPRLRCQTSAGPEHTKAIMCRTHDFKYVHRLYETDELYDLRRDPGELDNRIDDPALAPVRRQLQERLLTHYLETCDVVPLVTDRR